MMRFKNRLGKRARGPRTPFMQSSEGARLEQLRIRLWDGDETLLEDGIVASERHLYGLVSGREVVCVGSGVYLPGRVQAWTNLAVFPPERAPAAMRAN